MIDLNILIIVLLTFFSSLFALILFSLFQKYSKTLLKPKNLIILLSALLLIIIILLLFLNKNKDNVNAGSGNLFNQELDTDTYHLPSQIHEGGLNLVFFADNYNDWDDFENDVSILIQEMTKIKPWNVYYDFNIYRVMPKENNSICKVKTEDIRKPSLRCNVEINDYLAPLKLDRLKLVVLSRKNFESWANVARIKNSGVFFSVTSKLKDTNREPMGTLFSHLMGHAFGLKDEEKYIIAESGGAPHTPDGPNCAPNIETAKEWWGELAEQHPDKVGYYTVCAGNDNYIKPHETSLMNLNKINEVNSYGLVSELYLAKVLEYCFRNKKYSYEDDTTFFDRYPEFMNCLE